MGDALMFLFHDKSEVEKPHGSTLHCSYCTGARLSDDRI